MPEESFEEKARNMAEQFSMEPQPLVWQRVKAAIAPKSRRRAAFWWWLMPLCVAGGLGFWLLNSYKPLQKKEADVTQNSIAKTNSNTTGKVNKPNSNTNHKTGNHSTVNNKQNIASGQKKKADLFQQNNQSGNEKKDAKQKKEVMLFQPQTHFAINKNVVKENDVNKEKKATVVQPQTSFVNDTNALADSSKNDLQKDETEATDTLKTTAAIAIKTNDSLAKKTDSASVVIKPEKQKKNDWQIGMVAEAGATSWGNGLFGNSAASLFSASNNPNPQTNNNSGGSFAVVNQHKKTGIDAALGVTVHKNISKRLFFTGELTYRYQQFGIQQILFNLASAVENPHIYNNISYHLHFANMYTGIGVSIFHKKQTLVALQAGVDNSWLITMQQKQTHTSDSLKSLTTHNFQRWQPFINIAIPVNIYANKKVRWQLTPFFRSGLRSFQKSNSSYSNNHLVSAGMGIIYFFK